MNDVFEQMWLAATDDEAAVLQDLMLRVGLLWRCTAPNADDSLGVSCGEINDVAFSTCNECGALGPSAPAKGD